MECTRAAQPQPKKVGCLPPGGNVGDSRPRELLPANKDRPAGKHYACPQVERLDIGSSAFHQNCSSLKPQKVLYFADMRLSSSLQARLPIFPEPCQGRQ